MEASRASGGASRRSAGRSPRPRGSSAATSGSPPTVERGQRRDQAAGEDVALDPVRRACGSGPSGRRGSGSSVRTRSRPARAPGRSSRSTCRTAARRSPRASRSTRPSCSGRRARGSPARGSVDAVGEPGGGDALACEPRLLGGDRQRRHAAAGRLRPRAIAKLPQPQPISSTWSSGPSSQLVADALGACAAARPRATAPASSKTAHEYVIVSSSISAKRSLPRS